MRIFFISIIVVPALCALSGCRHNTNLNAGAADTLVFLMAGQSNMAGRGEISADDAMLNPHVLEMDETGAIQVKREPNTIFQGALAGLDCGRSFGNETLRELPAGATILLVQCSISSTSIQEWLGDSLHAVKLFSNMLSRTRLAARYGTLKGVLWMQGEADAETEAASTAYAGRLSAFIEKYRQESGMPDLPFFIGMLPAWCVRPYTAAVNAGIRKSAAGLPSLVLISTDDLSGKGDGIHLDAAGQRELGRRFAVAVRAQL